MQSRNHPPGEAAFVASFSNNTSSISQTTTNTPVMFDIGDHVQYKLANSQSTGVIIDILKTNKPPNYVVKDDKTDKTHECVLLYGATHPHPKVTFAIRSNRTLLPI
ncbi:hypothetical protein BC938DRAFT_473364 [Jimgerdemannia flammicorona]|uniref:Uncharacterized protein n=1 Tax=Jimgerdemannia flammicorona TaxID=994334 RepID=A0A433Q4J6_9FUNG|nr:hypothetical protein BC938DRAFT_473364 [Jimgerdemannia flammicorona]